MAQRPLTNHRRVCISMGKAIDDLTNAKCKEGKINKSKLIEGLLIEHWAKVGLDD